MCNNIAIHVGYRDPGFFHSVNIPNLEPGTTVKIRNGGRESRSFTPHPRILPGDSTRHSVALLGDLGVTGVIDGGGLVSGGALMFPSLHASVPLTHLQDNERIRLTILYGDISYADGYGTFWDQFGAEMEYKFAMKAPFVTSVGNHDYVSTNNPKGWYPDFGNYNQTDSGGECGVPFTHRFAFRDGSKEPKYWYSFDSGLVHYVMMSTEHNWLNGSAQHKWLENDLANVDRKKTPWVIVTGHRAMYQSCKGFDVDDDVGRHLISDVAPVLRKHHVDVYVAGHYHLYERTAAIDGIVHVLAGSPRFMEVTSCERFKVPWYKKGVFTHGYVELDVVNSTLLNFTYWGYNATISAMAVEDSFQVSKIE
ncbi:Nucleotide pyrophosphatase/phosphodiesterase, putative [Perkinsus marinus ATCC 50983]|uniref:Nucleotide pyrophosphatase/phosphodiesterase, putative n=1 Tax=Perkinsus marinus (strain ATCC 50983 / TXsc) TaxID=423536 RepID=C5LBL8_PERM5|nr:Nucleotide pyrophosphatase/phosphodiesterase, putative [Perkinsus marinus ATCC 50983]EER05839.1 Nucleotide pyrophosphatase/phosphodiesterase, putative [Perkinsus marinus ATCC 50983]|eukprot:XP_002774023.1 Nucleotide pyrophosphatase/phosphodiesterase, putative [Perkinsus marinus ATCC 50983]